MIPYLIATFTITDTDYSDNVAHGEELKYIWDDGTNSDPSKFSPDDRLAQKRLLTLWTNFIKFR